MRRKLVLYVWLVWMLGSLAFWLSVVVVSAQTDTPTPTHTSYPTFLPTGTSVIYEFPDEFDCPAGLPAGYGTLTPNAFWSASCAQCMTTLQPTSTSIITSTPNPTATGTPATPTSGPTATSTPFSSVIIECGTGTTQDDGVTCTDVGLNWIRWDSDIPNDDEHNAINTFQGWALSHGQGSPTYIYMKFSTVAGAWSHTPSFWPAEPADLQLQMGIHGIPPFAYGDPFDTPSECAGGNAWCGNVLQQDFYHTFFASSGTGDGLFRQSMVQTALGTIFFTKNGWSMEMSLVAFPSTPTPSSGGTSYCASIDGGGADAEFDPALSWSGVYYGYNACIDIGGWEISVLGIDITVPLIRICMQDVSFANLVIFGMTVSLDAVLYVLVGAWALRSMWNS